MEKKNKSKKKKIVLKLTRSDVLKVGRRRYRFDYCRASAYNRPVITFWSTQAATIGRRTRRLVMAGPPVKITGVWSSALTCALDVNTVCAPAVPRTMCLRLLHGT